MRGLSWKEKNMNAHKGATEAQIEALNKFIAVAQTKVDEYNAQYSHKDGKPSILRAQFGRKYVKVMQFDDFYVDGRTYCYVDLATGSILKPAGRYGIQDKIERGNIYRADNGASGVNWFGAVYVR
jgi:hypothetical protein